MGRWGIVTENNALGGGEQESSRLRLLKPYNCDGTPEL